MGDEALQIETGSSSPSATWGERFLEQSRRAAKGNAWSYETIQALKRLDREEFLAHMRQRGSFRYEDFQKARELSPERFADWMAGDWEGAASELPPGDGPWGARFVARYRWIADDSLWFAETTKQVEGLELEEFLALMRQRGDFQYEYFQAARRLTPEDFAAYVAKEQEAALISVMCLSMATMVASL